MYVRENIQSRQLFCKSQFYIENISVAISLKNRKRFLNGSYNPQRNSTLNHLHSIYSLFEKLYEAQYNCPFIGDFDVSMEDNFIKSFYNLNGLKRFISVRTYSKSQHTLMTRLNT